MRVFWNQNYTSIKHNFDTSRKSDNIVQLIKTNQNESPSKVKLLKDIPDIQIIDPEQTTDISVTERLINKWLDPQYVQALKTNNNDYLSESQGFPWCENTYKFARAHTHGLIASVEEIKMGANRSGSLSSGLHHASRSSGSGFCTINGIALSAIHAYEQGFEPIILDFDAHCGGGTMDFLKAFNKTFHTSVNPIRHIDLTTNGFDGYNIDSEEDWAYLHTLWRGEDYLQQIEKALAVSKPFITDKTLFIYNAGIDPIGSHGIDENVITEREQMVSRFIGDSKAIFALAGGYSGRYTSRDDVAKTHLRTIYGWSWQTK
jgi:acetoin utilization deacetylase AcuC-like enzyme